MLVPPDPIEWAQQGISVAPHRPLRTEAQFSLLLAMILWR
jgi:hypothetical protein